MSNNDEIDDEVARLLAKTGSDDSKSSEKKDDKKYKNDEFNDYEIDDRDPLKHDEMDDKDW